ncbi:MAG: hypothetical protein KDK70_39195 [Myxococcales bacterium]|nr:hypothetical protein [Myxococcales bacterium]MCB9664178.1 hypothetical protein [Alphaproteobacteria bacterium]
MSGSAEPAQPGSVGQGRFERVARIARIVLAGGLVVAAVGASLPLLRIGAHVLDDRELDGIAVAVALDWRDFGLERARQRLQHELDRRGVEGIDERVCALTLEADAVRRVACAWEVEVELPLRERPLTLAFASVARVDRHGTVVY